MKKLLWVYTLPLPLDIALLIARIAGGAFMLTHGIPKLQKLQAGTGKFMNFMGLGSEMTGILAVCSEVGFALLLLIGLLSRVSAGVLAFTMIIAAFVAHAGDPFKNREMALMYLVIYLILLLSGPGRFSVDALLGKKKAR